MFLDRTRRALSQSLAEADRLFDFLRASALVGMYFTLTGKLRVGYHYTSALQFALACRLHEIASLDISCWPGGLLQPPKNLAELGDRLHLFWMLVSNDRLNCLLLRFPVVVPDRLIKAVWPYPAVYYEETYSEDGLLQPPIASYADVRALEKNHCTFRAQVICVLSMAYGVDSRFKSSGCQRTDSFLQEIEYVDAEMASLARNLPPFPEKAALPEYVDDTVFPVTCIALVLFHTATITLHELIAKSSEKSKQRCLTSAQAIVDVIARVNATDPPCVVPLQAILALSWKAAFDVLTREVNTMPSASDTAIKVNLDRLLECMRSVARHTQYLRPVVEKMTQPAA